MSATVDAGFKTSQLRSSRHLPALVGHGFLPLGSSLCAATRKRFKTAFWRCLNTCTSKRVRPRDVGRRVENKLEAIQAMTYPILKSLTKIISNTPCFTPPKQKHVPFTKKNNTKTLTRRLHLLRWPVQQRWSYQLLQLRHGRRGRSRRRQLHQLRLGCGELERSSWGFFLSC